MSQPRRIVHRTAGHTQGPITRLMSPGDAGELVKPFVFLDYFEMEAARGPGMADHPHSGIATHTTLLEGGLRYHDSTGKSGRLPPGSVEWMQAGGGVWHGGNPEPGARVRGYQLWVALPAALELTPAQSFYLEPSALETDGRVRVLLGHYGALASALPDVAPMTYLHVRLQDGETWQFDPPAGHDVAWLAVNAGVVEVSGVEASRELVVFEEGSAPLVLRARGEVELVLGSATKHPHPLICGYYSVHTSEAALSQGEAGIRRVASELRAQTRAAAPV